MITLRSLAQMKPGAGDFDPRLYQYGGLWIYPIAAMIKGAGLVHLITITNDRVRKEILAVPAFQKDGHFDPDTYRMMLTAQGTSAAALACTVPQPPS